MYSPQANISATRSGTDPVTLTVNVGGTAFQWYNWNNAVTGETNNTISVNLADIGGYYCKITNSNFPDLTLESEVEEIGNVITQGVRTEDYDGLIALYNSTDGNNWTDNTNWTTTTDVNDWYGVTIENYRVTQINLGSNNLIGSIPSEIGNLSNLNILSLGYNQLSTTPTEIGDLSNLEYLYLDNNQLSTIPTEIGNLSNLIFLSLNNNQLNEIPDLSVLTKLTYCYIDNNKLDFDDLTNANISSSNYGYSPQAKVGSEQSFLPANEEQVVLSISVGGAANTYQWYKGGTEISGATATSYTIESYNPDTDKGVYICKIKNAGFSELTLETEKYYVGVTSYTINVSLNNTEAGSVIGDGAYHQGDEATLTATANTGFLFVNWTEDGTEVSTEAAYSFTVDADRTLVASFKSTTTGIEDVENIVFKLYPNPARDIINISSSYFKTNNKAMFRIIDRQGKVSVFNTQNVNGEQVQLNISGLPAGLYYLQIISGKTAKETVKFIIVK